METSERARQEFEALVREAYRASEDVGEEVEQILRDGREHPLDEEEASQLLSRVVGVLRRSAVERGDEVTAKALEGDTEEVVRRIVRSRSRATSGEANSAHRAAQVQLFGSNGVEVDAVRPPAIFQGREVPMKQGYVKTRDIQLWDKNERLDIHLAQFRTANNREPTPEELLSIMLSDMDLPGVAGDDQFKIEELARSIAVNGIKKAPIIDLDGTLLDGNRRVTACYYILNSDEFDSEAKRRADEVRVWQLTEHATSDDRNAVVVASNFEPDHKIDWPEYVKAKKVYQEWQTRLALEARTPGRKREIEMKKALSMDFALGPRTDIVTRYIRMVTWADAFEEYHTIDKGRDTYAVRHRANQYFQYFDELSKGEATAPSGDKVGGVGYLLRQDDSMREAAFDLLFRGLFKNWTEIRDLKYVYDNDEARERMVKARSEPDEEEARDHLEIALDTARTRRADVRAVGANSRIKNFVKWLEEVPPKELRDNVSTGNLQGLLEALKLVEPMVESILKDREDGRP